MSCPKILSALGLALLLLLPLRGAACPACADAVQDTSGAEALDQEREAQAYNHSIYLMVGMPYLLLSGMGLMIYRGYRRQAKAFAERTAFAAADNGGSGHVLATLPADPTETVAPGRSDC